MCLEIFHSEKSYWAYFGTAKLFFIFSFLCSSMSFLVPQYFFAHSMGNSSLLWNPRKFNPFTEESLVPTPKEIPQLCVTDRTKMMGKKWNDSKNPILEKSTVGKWRLNEKSTQNFIKIVSFQNRPQKWLCFITPSFYVWNLSPLRVESPKGGNKNTGGGEWWRGKNQILGVFPSFLFPAVLVLTVCMHFTGFCKIFV